MTNSWLRIPASDYEGHMSSSNVAQQQFLAQIFKELLNKHDSSIIALLGCATGNGLEGRTHSEHYTVDYGWVLPEILGSHLDL